jgi:hypothetical protein
MIPVEKVRELLKDRNISVVAEATGLKVRALYRFKTGDAKTLTAEDWLALSNYFASQMQAAGFAPAENVALTAAGG